MIFEPNKGQNFYDAVKDCKKEMRRANRLYMIMKFNDINVTISYDSNDDDIATIYDLKKKLIKHNLDV